MNRVVDGFQGALARGDGRGACREIAAPVGAALSKQENPLGLALGAVGVGLLAGLLVPSTRIEDEKLGPVADDVKDKVRETGEEALEHGKQVAQEAAGAAKETAQEKSQQHADELRDSATNKADEARQTAGA